MPLNLVIEPEALAELTEAAAFYEVKRAGRGARLVAAVDETIRRIGEYPAAWPLIDGDLRRCDVDGFPYWLVYECSADTVRVVAVSHPRREPGYWRERVSR